MNMTAKLYRPQAQRRAMRFALALCGELFALRQVCPLQDGTNPLPQTSADRSPLKQREFPKIEFREIVERHYVPRGDALRGQEPRQWLLTIFHMRQRSAKCNKKRDLAPTCQNLNQSPEQSNVGAIHPRYECVWLVTVTSQSL